MFGLSYFSNYKINVSTDNNVNLAVYVSDNSYGNTASYYSSTEGTNVELDDINCDSYSAIYLKIESIDGSDIGDITITITANY